MKKQTRKAKTPKTETAPQDAADMVDVKVEARQIPLHQIDTNPDNPRQMDPNDPALAELAESIAKTGLLQPILVRPMPDGRYQVRAGARRFAAHQRLGAESILCIVRDMTDAEAMQATVLENLQRKDLTLFEEADGVDRLVRLGRPIGQIAAELGKSPSWTDRRASLANLAAGMKTRIEDNELSLETALALATMSPEDQAEALKEWPSWTWNGNRSNEIIQKVEETRHLLAKAIFNKADCAGCQKRSDRINLLFEDTETANPKKIKCLDGKCWKQKHEIELGARRIRAMQDHPNLVEVRTEYNSGMDSVPEFRKDAVSPYQAKYRALKKDDPPEACVYGLIVYGPGEGKLVEMVSLETKKPEAVEAGPKPEKTDLDRIADLVNKRKAWMVDAFRPLLRGESPIPAENFATWAPKKILSVVMAFGTCSRQNSREPRSWRQYQEDTATSARERWLSEIIPVLHSGLHVRTLADAAEAWSEVLRIAALFDWDIFAELREKAIEAVPMSKRLQAAHYIDPFSLTLADGSNRDMTAYTTPGPLGENGFKYSEHHQDEDESPEEEDGEE